MVKDPRECLHEAIGQILRPVKRGLTSYCGEGVAPGIGWHSTKAPIFVL